MKQFEDIKILQQKKITVEQLYEAPVKLEKLTGDIGINNNIVDRNIYRPQLALTGYVDLFTYKQVQILGNTEIFYLKSLSKDERIKAFQTICHFPIPCMILTNNHKLEPELLNIAKKNKIAILNTPYETTKATFLLSEFLDDQFSPQSVVHGSLVDVYGVGILITGRSGIGKSEIALDLVERGHRLVADDLVMITRRGRGILIGNGRQHIQHHLEIRGIGIIDVMSLYGIRGLRLRKRIEVEVQLVEDKPLDDLDRT